MIGCLSLAGLGLLSAGLSQALWTPQELKILGTMTINKLGPVPQDPSNAVADDPQAAVLGQKLFFDKRLSANGDVSCASCHAVDKYFSDDQAQSEGVGMTDRKSPSLVGAAYNKWYFWDGRADSQWAQALGPLESAVEHGSDRSKYAKVIFANYKTEYQAVFGQMPDLTDISRFPTRAGPVANVTANSNWQIMSPEDRNDVTRVFVNIGKSIAAYERKLNPGSSRFDRFVEGLLAQEDSSAMSDNLSIDETNGLKLFIGKANCISCHTGPLLTDGQFHNTGVPNANGSQTDLGRGTGLQKLSHSEFTCLSRFSDAKPEQCAKDSDNSSSYDTVNDLSPMDGAFKTPSLRGATLHAPLMHAGQFSNVTEVLKYYSQAPESPVGKSELKPLNLSALEISQLEAFVKSLEAPIRSDTKWLEDPFSK
jgi:cytochrome c peroxidase